MMCEYDSYLAKKMKEIEERVRASRFDKYAKKRNAYKRAKREQEAEMKYCFTCGEGFRNKQGKAINCGVACSEIYEKNRYRREKGIICIVN